MFQNSFKLQGAAASCCVGPKFSLCDLALTWNLLRSVTLAMFRICWNCFQWWTLCQNIEANVQLTLNGGRQDGCVCSCPVSQINWVQKKLYGRLISGVWWKTVLLPKKKKSKLQKGPQTIPCGSLCYYCSLVLKCCNSTDKNGKGWCWVASSLGLFGLSCLDSRGCTHGMSCWSILRQLHPSQMMNLWCLCAVRPLWVGWNFMSGCFLTGSVCDNFNNLRSAHEWSLESSILYLLFGRYHWYLAIKLLSFSKMCLERSWIYLALSLILGSSWHKESWNILYLPSWKLLCFAV